MTLGPHEDGFLGWASPLEVLSALLLESQLTQAPIYMLQPQVHTILNFCYRAVESLRASASPLARDAAASIFEDLTIRGDTTICTFILNLTNEVTTLEQFRRFLVIKLGQVLTLEKARPSAYFGVFLRQLSLKAEQMTFTQMTQSFSLWQDWSSEVQSRLAREQCAAEGIKATGLHHPSFVSRRGLEDQGKAEVGLVRQSHSLFVRAWRIGDYSSALSQLSRYFDYTVSSTVTSSYQYALLNLALLQADFGCHKESLWAMHETIDAARDNYDERCLGFALSWLYTNGENLSLGNVEASWEVIAHAHANHMPEIESLAYTSCSMKESGFDRTKNVLKSQRVLLRNAINIDTRGYKMVADMWDALDVLELSHIALRLGQTFCRLGKDSECDARLRCAMAKHLWRTGKHDDARKLLQTDHHRSQAYNKICRIQLAVFNLQQTESANDADEHLEYQEIVRDPLSAVPRIRRHIKARNLSAAWSLNEEHLAPHSHYNNKSSKSMQYEVAYLRMKTEILLASSEPERAIAVAVIAAHLAYKHALCKDLREIKEYYF